MRQSFETGLALLKIHLLRKRIPLFLSWNITFRCNLRCVYCAACEALKEELDTNEIKEGLDALWRLGTRWITFGGGEPLLRQDIGEVFHYAKNKGFHVYASTNGWFVPEKARALGVLDHVNLSLDGPKETHDAIRGKGAFDSVIAAIETLKALKISTSLLCVLSNYNLDAVDEAVAIAQSHGLTIMFQPATRWLNSSVKDNPHIPDTAAYRKAIDHIVQLKKAGRPIRNSHAGLRHLAQWPTPTPIFCVAGRGMAIVEADGSMLACHQCQFRGRDGVKKSPGSIHAQFKEMNLPATCVQCWCAPLVELGLVFSFNLEAIYNAFRNG